ncbi:hypothetical protein FACS189432_04570 [Bacteroidia bacterium]|nr:hypothetical protein FACS189426_04880 [Bacteroidia bacterium]GHT27683.1 hypothetical protein FACS189432_04570 [Bacteroidia bacterium]
MNKFSNIKELFSALKKEENLLSEMFKKRKSVKNFQYDYALDLVENNDNRIKYLLDREVIRQNGNNLEIDDLFLQFFEQVLDANEEINVSYINENLEKITQNIQYFLNETNENRKYEYLRKIKTTLRNIGNITLRNVVDLKRNVNNTFKNEPNYKNKKAKLINLDKKRKDIAKLIEQTEKLLSEREVTFFTTATDEELNRIIVQLKMQLGKCSHNLIEIERQIIDFLNQIQYQSTVIEKLRKIKYLKDQYILETSTDIKTVLLDNNSVIFEPNPQYPLKLSLEFLQTNEDAFASIQKIAKRVKAGVKMKQPIADKISSEYLQTQTEEEIQINLEEVKNGFMASGYALFDFVLNYNFAKDVSFDEKITIYCQLISQYESIFEITDNFQEKENIEFAVVYPK